MKRRERRRPTQAGTYRLAGEHRWFCGRGELRLVAPMGAAFGRDFGLATALVIDAEYAAKRSWDSRSRRVKTEKQKNRRPEGRLAVFIQPRN